MLALNNEVINMVERRGFVRLLKAALPRYKISSYLYFSEKILLGIYDKSVAKIKKLLSDANSISFTSDMRTCLNNYVSFLSFAAHWVDANFNLKHAVLNIKHLMSHTVDRI